jgi:hypothetical protein
VNGWDTQTLCPSRERGPGRAKPCLDSREGPEDSGSGRPGGREVGKLRNLRKLRRVGSSGGSEAQEGREVRKVGRSREAGGPGGPGGRKIGKLRSGGRSGGPEGREAGRLGRNSVLVAGGPPSGRRNKRVRLSVSDRPGFGARPRGGCSTSVLVDSGGIPMAVRETVLTMSVADCVAVS